MPEALWAEICRNCGFRISNGSCMPLKLRELSYVSLEPEGYQYILDSLDRYRDVIGPEQLVTLYQLRGS